MSTNAPSPTIDAHQIMAAGLASTGAAFVTSRFGVAGTLLGAALTAMIITGGSTVLRAYIANASSRVRGGATRLRDRRGEQAVGSGPAPTREAPRQGTLPGRPDLRNNGVGRLRAALDWFRNLPTSGRRPIIIKALVAAGVAFVICMVAIWGVEKVIGNSLSCGFWGTCPLGVAPGVDPLGLGGTGTGSTISGGDVDVGDGGGGVLDRVQNSPIVPDGPDVLPGGADSSASPAPEGGGSASPAAEPVPEEEAPSSASPAAEPDASPAAEEQAAPDSSASPAP